MSTCPAGHELAWWVDKKGWVVGYDPSKVAAGSDVSSGGQSNDHEGHGDDVDGSSHSISGGSDGGGGGGVGVDSTKSTINMTSITQVVTVKRASRKFKEQRSRGRRSSRGGRGGGVLRSSGPPGTNTPQPLGTKSGIKITNKF